MSAKRAVRPDLGLGSGFLESKFGTSLTHPCPSPTHLGGGGGGGGDFGGAEFWSQEAGFLHFTGDFEIFLRLRRLGRRRWGSGGAAPGPRPKKLVREISPFLP